MTHSRRSKEQSPEYEGEDVKPGSARCTLRPSVAQWGVQELVLDGPCHGNPFSDVEIAATFQHGDDVVTARGFYDGDGTYRIRFMPELEGTWTFRTRSSERSLTGIEGSFTCEPPAPWAHGPVRVTAGFHFAHADGTPYRPIGTTCYAWTHQDEALEERTLASLQASPFNKVRMCVFPKSYLYNENEPERHAFERLEDGTFDLTRFVPSFFQHLELRVADLARLGIEADLILFHPYDRWGYAAMPPDVDDRYLRYVVARLSAYANVWWSLANEYDLMGAKKEVDWDRFGSVVCEADPHRHLTGVHQCFDLFDHSKPWVTHASVQRLDDHRTTENTTEWRERWRKPVVVDECGYEGDIDMTWGNISGQELTRRFWEGTVRGCYVSHGETYASPDDVLWWSKGGELRGTSAARIAFLRSVVEIAPPELEPMPHGVQSPYPTVGVAGTYYLQYLGIFQPRWRTFELPDGPYRVELIDTWNMTIEDAGVHTGSCRIPLPGRSFMAIRITRDCSRDEQMRSCTRCYGV